MLRIRRSVASLSLIGLFCVWFASAQDVPGVNETDLEVVKTGHFRTKSGHAIPFRVLKAPNGTEAQILYTRFNSLEAAELQIEEWVKATRTVTSREHNQTKGDQLISDRTLGVADVPKSDKKEFVIIRRDYLNCYLIESVSLQVALRVEDLLEHK